MDEVEPPDEASTLVMLSRRRETPCGDGNIVWHIWGMGHPVVLLHGASGSWTHWLRNVRTLVDAGRTVLVPDLPGFGASAKPQAGEDADAICGPLLYGIGDLLGKSSWDLVGFSFGSIVAGLLSAQAGQIVRRMVLIAAPIVPLASKRGVAFTPWRHLATQPERDEVHRLNLATMMLHRSASIDTTALALQSANAPRDRMRQRRMVTTDALARALALVSCPLWAIYGQEDAVYRDSWPEVCAAWQAYPNLRELVIVPDAGHWVQYEEQHRVNALLLHALGD